VLAGKKIFVYAGNMGIAQGMEILIDLAEQFKSRIDVGFLFVGRGKDAKRLQDEVASRSLENVVFFDEIEPEEIPGLYQQCDVGLVVLDTRHKTHNIPGKFLSYIQAGLPVLASVNDGNDIIHLIESQNVGFVSTDASAQTLKIKAEQLLIKLEEDSEFNLRCNTFSADMFSPNTAAKKILHALRGEKK
jgi:glycosyltransferase involved in cell wall biosynthesis